MSENMGTPAIEQLHREMEPLLTEICMLEPGDDEHLCVKQLFNWFVDQHRTGEEFHYVLGPLRQHVLITGDEDIVENVQDYYNLGNVAIEALAVNYPILKGSWEQAAWLLVMTNKNVLCNYGGANSDCIMNWITEMIGNADYCPNPFLRFKFITLLLNMDNLNDHNWTKAFESVLFACPFIDIGYLIQPLPFDDPSNYSRNFSLINEILKLFAREGYLLEFDRKLANQLLEVKTVRLCAIFRDVTYNSALNPNIYAEPLALNSLTALLKMTAGLIQWNQKKWKGMPIPLDSRWNLYDMNEVESESWIYLLSDITNTTDMLRLLICKFNKSCQTPQLVDLTASSVIAAIELVIHFYASSPVPQIITYEVFKYNSLNNINQLLEELFYGKDVLRKESSPVAKEIHLRYKEKLSFLRGFQTNQGFLKFSNIMDLVLDQFYY